MNNIERMNGIVFCLNINLVSLNLPHLKFKTHLVIEDTQNKHIWHHTKYVNYYSCIMMKIIKNINSIQFLQILYYNGI